MAINKFQYIFDPRIPRRDIPPKQQTTTSDKKPSDKKSIFIQITRYQDINFVVDRFLTAPLNKENTMQNLGAVAGYTGLSEAKIIKEIETPIPLINIGDSFYFEDEKMMVKIKSVCKTDKNNTIYIVEDKSEYTTKSLKRYEKDKQAFLDKEKLNDKYYHLRMAIIEKNKTDIKKIINNW